jgi:hypothetical protein
VSLDQWKGIFDLPVTLVSHQYTESAPQEIGPYADRILHWHALATEKNGDLDWNISLVDACDLLISVNTTAIHIAGAMNKECWTLTPYGRAWRYGRSHERKSLNPFYNSVTQYNQKEGEPWADVMAEVVEDLKAWLK